MAYSWHQIPTPFVPSEKYQIIAVQTLDKLIDDSKTGEHPPHVTTTHSGISSYVRNFFPYESFEDFENSWHLGNYVIERHTNEKTFENMSIYVRLGMHFIYYGPAHEKVLKWKKARDLLEYHSKQLGAAYDTPVSKAHIEPFINFFKLHDSLAELEEPDPTKYATFNDFFARRLHHAARPITLPDDKFVISSPADCRLMLFPTTDLATKYWIKGYGFTIAKLLRDQKLAKQYEGGAMIIARLAPQDYHRWHSPCDGFISKVTEIPGTYYTVNPQAINQPGTLDVFCENRRSVMLLARQAPHSPVLVIAVGAMLVGSIKYDVPEGTTVQRGQCLGAFQYGGSTVIVLMPKDEFIPDEDLVENSTKEKCETLVKVGWKLGRSPDPFAHVVPLPHDTCTGTANQALW